MPNTILKLVYKIEFFDLSEMRPGARQVTTITADGVIVEKEYVTGSRKVLSSRTAECPVEAYSALCKQIVDCINNADRSFGYCDDATEELTIYHKFGRIQKMDRGLGNENICIGEVLSSFLQKYMRSKG